MVAITEAVNNSIYHGNRGDFSKWVFIRCAALNPYRILIAVEDQGSGFDPDSLPDPTAPENLENPGGRGVFLMRHLSDEIKFHNEGRRVEMVFNI
jgi:serine/threonine-protein kinase RsbW